MILDTSVIVAIVLDEPERDAFIAKIDDADSVGVGVPTLVEAGIVLAALTGAEPSELLAELVAAREAVVIEFGEAHWQVALSA